jgi:hypothetical protein
MRDTASFVVAEAAVDPERVRSDQSTIRVWIPGEREALRRPRPAPRTLGRRIAAELGIPLPVNPVLRARFATRDRVPRMVWFLIGAVFAVGAAVVLLAVSTGDPPSIPAPAALPATIDAEPASAPATELPRMIELPADVAPVQTLNVVTNVEIKTTYSASDTSYKRGRDARSERRSKPAGKNASAAPAIAAPAARPEIEDNPYAGPAAPKPTVDENPY